MAPGDLTQGRRVPDDDPPHEYAPGDYGLWNGEWRCRVPANVWGAGRLGQHEVTEHEDGTITVSPSILISTSVEGRNVEVWHGYLERGVWREV